VQALLLANYVCDKEEGGSEVDKVAKWSRL
jgi:hypothetical protein